MNSPKRDVAVIGGGPAGLMTAETLVAQGLSVDVYERMPSLGRRFLMAGRGGLNLTHSEPLADLVTRYGEARDRLGGPVALTAFWRELGDGLTTLNRSETALNRTDPRSGEDSTTPMAMATTLATLMRTGPGFPLAARDTLLGWMRATKGEGAAS